MNNLSKYIDHTLLKITAGEQDYIKLCQEAVSFNFFSVCVPPHFTPFVKKKLRNSSVKICSVVGFPSGLSSLKTKIYETEQLLINGADEIDLVANISLIKQHKWDLLFKEISRIKKSCGKHILKVIVESSLLTKDEILNCCLILKEAGADFIKTSTGFNGPGARLDDVQYMFKILKNSNVKIKASGGIRSLNTASTFIRSGCQRLGTSSGVKIINQLKTGSNNETSSSSNY